MHHSSIGGVQMKYCRYCTQSVAHSDDYAWCEYKKRMVGKAATRRDCKGYEFCRIDAFYAFRGLEVTDPKALYTPRKPEPEPDLNQVTLIEWLSNEMS